VCRLGQCHDNRTITDAPLTGEDSLAVANGAQVELAEVVRAKIADDPAVMDPDPAAGNAVHGLTTPVGHGKDTKPGTGSLRLTEPCLIYGGIMYYLLLHDVVDQFAERRTPLPRCPAEASPRRRGQRRVSPRRRVRRPLDGAALVFKAADQSVAERFAANDPYVAAGLVTKWAVRKWTVAVEAVP
jgi:uncharacterized protein